MLLGGRRAVRELCRVRACQDREEEDATTTRDPICTLVSRWPSEQLPHMQGPANNHHRGHMAWPHADVADLDLQCALAIDEGPR